jgi:hypothetical protein
MFSQQQRWQDWGAGEICGDGAVVHQVQRRAACQWSALRQTLPG